jgi:hypothetical protein
MKKKDIEKIEQEENGVKIITPRHVLREKIGFGGIEPLVLERAEEFIKKNDVDYIPYAKEFFDKVDMAIETVRAKAARDRTAINSISRPVMGLKASGSMFHYALLTETSDVMLNFLEGLETLNDDAFDILAVYKKIISAIITGKMSGDGGKTGKLLTDELYSACHRYMRKHAVQKD